MAESTLVNVPVIVDPLATTIELQHRLRSGNVLWTHLYRLTITPDDVFPTVSLGGSNLYGTAETLAESKHVLAYSPDGYLVDVYHHYEDAGWVIHPVPPEFNGRRVLYAALRLFFTVPPAAMRAESLCKSLQRQYLLACDSNVSGDTPILEILDREEVEELLKLLVSQVQSLGIVPITTEQKV